MKKLDERKKGFEGNGQQTGKKTVKTVSRKKTGAKRFRLRKKRGKNGFEENETKTGQKRDKHGKKT